MNPRRRRLVVVAAWLATLRAAAVAQTAGARDRRVLVGRLSEGGPSPVSAAAVAAFRDALRRHGYANVEIEARYAEGDPQRLTLVTQELVRMGVDVIWTAGSVATKAAKDATGTIPVVMVSADAVKGGLVANLAHPEGNLTGLTLIGTELVVKRIEILKSIAPKTVRLTALAHGPGATQYPIVVEWLQHSEQAARALGLAFRFAELAPDPDTWGEAFAGLAATPGNALSLIESPVFLTHSQLLAQLALRHRLPAVFSFRRHVEVGGLASYGINVQHIAQRSAYYVARLLDGARPRDLPVEQPTKYEIAVNVATAKMLGLTIPRSVLLRADEVIE
jgi:putative ABC transport system substrate-binding protein